MGSRVALALGAGGARGYAHIGVVEELQARGHQIVSVAGTSMGALVGGVVAAGRLAEFTEWAVGLKQRDVLRLAGLKWSTRGALTAQGALTEVERLVEGIAIEDLPIPFTAVATDLVARREVWFQRGPLAHALRASIAIPGLFVPAVIDNRVLVDGGLLNPVPIDPTAATASDFTVAVALQGHRSPRESSTPVVESSAPQRPGAWRDGLLRRFRRDVDVEQELDDEPVVSADDTGAADLNAAEVVTYSYDAMQDLITRFRLAAQPPDVLITVPVDSAAALEFHRAGELIEVGRTLAREALDSYQG